MNRRKLLGVGLASLVTPLSMRVANASASKDNSEQMVNMLFVQSAHGAELANGKLRLTGGASSLFIDTVGRPMSPGSVAGVKRRERRRTVRLVR